MSTAIVCGSSSLAPSPLPHVTHSSVSSKDHKRDPARHSGVRSNRSLPYLLTANQQVARRWTYIGLLRSSSIGRRYLTSFTRQSNAGAFIGRVADTRSRPFWALQARPHIVISGISAAEESASWRIPPRCSSSEEGVGGWPSKLSLLRGQLLRLRSSFIEGVERIASRD